MTRTIVLFVSLPLTLGYNRSIPGYPRYAMTGDASEGVHNLKITDARIDDEGTYECQVGPGLVRHSLPIKASSKVTVLCEFSVAT